MRLSSLWAAIALSLGVSAAWGATYIEVDIVHPRNTTYIAAEVFPVAFKI